MKNVKNLIVLAVLLLTAYNYSSAQGLPAGTKTILNFAVLYIPISGDAVRTLDAGGTWNTIPRSQSEILSKKINEKTIQTQAETDIKVFPNPASKVFMLEIGLKEASSVVVSLVENNGNQTQVWTGEVGGGLQNIALNLQQFGQGSYFLKIETKEYTKSIKIINL